MAISQVRAVPSGYKLHCKKKSRRLPTFSVDTLFSAAEIEAFQDRDEFGDCIIRFVKLRIVLFNRISQNQDRFDEHHDAAGKFGKIAEQSKHRFFLQSTKIRELVSISYINTLFTIEQVTDCTKYN